MPGIWWQLSLSQNIKLILKAFEFYISKLRNSWHTWKQFWSIDINIYVRLFLKPSRAGYILFHTYQERSNNIKCHHHSAQDNLPCKTIKPDTFPLKWQSTFYARCEFCINLIDPLQNHKCMFKPEKRDPERKYNFAS